MYKGKYNVNGRHSNNPRSQSHRRDSVKITVRKRKKKNQKLVVAGLAILIVIIISISLFVAKRKDVADNNGLLDDIKGTWVYNQYVQYEFDGYGNGCMCLEDVHYEYVYEIEEDALWINFKDNSVHDCSYSYNVKDDTLIIVGGEGTAGGTYKLYRELK